MRTRLSTRRFARSDSGAAMVEFAIVLPILIMFLLGIIDFGRAFFLYNNLTNAVREGARLGAVQMPNVNVAAVQTRVTDRVRQFTSNPSAAPSVSVSSTAQDVTVTVNGYAFQPITPLPQAQSINMTVTAVFRRETAP